MITEFTDRVLFLAIDVQLLHKYGAYAITQLMLERDVW